jgi:metallo-beta-lactamase family protein
LKLTITAVFAAEGGNVTVKLKFLGASGTVTGSKYLVRSQLTSILVDAGLFQGERRWREENWLSNETDFADIDAVLITHAHIDHIGMLPRFVKMGLRCPVFCTKATAELARLLLPDSARLQEEEARYRNDSKRSRHQPALPLYTENDALKALELIREVPFSSRISISQDAHVEWRRAGHILGAASIHLEIADRRITFSGDIGRFGVPILKDPEPMLMGDLLLIESTYGDSLHTDKDPCPVLAQIIASTAARGGVTVIPSFAVGRAQLLLYYLRELKERKLIPDLPVIVDSPMAADATTIYANSPEDYDEAALGIANRGAHPFTLSKLAFTQDRAESIKLNQIKQPMVIISASGMLSGGRILHHLKHRITDSRNTILFVGHQPVGGRGDWLLKGNKSLRLFADELPVKAQIAQIGALSAHGDRDDLLRWCRQALGQPSKVAVVHGEPEVAEKFAKTITQQLGWQAFVAQFRQEIEV